MVRARYALATAAVVAVAAPLAWKLAEERSEAPLPIVRPETQADRVAPPTTPDPAAREPSRPQEAAGETTAQMPRVPRFAQAPAFGGIGRGYGFAPGSEAEASVATAPAPAVPAKPAAPADIYRGQVQAFRFSGANGFGTPAVTPSFRSEIAPPTPSPVGPAKPVITAAAEKPALRFSGGRAFGDEARSAPSLPTRSVQAPAPLGAREGHPPSFEPSGRDSFAEARENGFQTVAQAPVSTFSIDVDTASYSFLRTALGRNVLPPKASVRIEELINYFPYAYAGPASAAEPFAVTSAVFPSPWAAGRKIVQVGIKGYAVPAATRPPANLVFLVDTSGSMDGPNRLPLVKQSLALLLTQLGAKDRVAIVAYAGRAGTVLEPTPADRKARILGAIEALGAGGGTAGGEGIRQAYALAERGFDPKAVNRVILATDGDFNVGIANRAELQGFVERQRDKGIFLSVLGFGMGNYNDALMQALAQNGNGAAAYIDTLNEARKVLVEEATSTLIPIARDVKIQVEFNPRTVAEYRLIGYESRLLAREDFANDRVDAGDVGSGQGVTALYEIVPVGGPRVNPDLRYGAAPAEAAAGPADEYAHVAIRYKLPKAAASSLMTTPIDRTRESARFEDAPQEARFATAVAAFGALLKGGTHTGTLDLDAVAQMASAARGEDPFGYRAEFMQLVRAAKTAQALAAQGPGSP